MTIALLAYCARFDYGGFPLIHHYLHIADQMPDELTCAAALLHDALNEDKITPDTLREAMIPEPVIEALMLLDEHASRTYSEYIEGIRNNKIARTVRIADLKHDLDEARLEFADRDPDSMWQMTREHELELLEAEDTAPSDEGDKDFRVPGTATGEFFYGMVVPESVLSAVAKAAGKKESEIYDEWDDARGIWVTLPNGQDIIPIHLSSKWSEGVMLTPLFGVTGPVENEFFLESFRQMSMFSSAYKSVEAVIEEFRNAIGEYVDDPASDKDWWWKARIGTVRCAIYRRDPPRH